jgi:hypothetical protein
MWDAATITAVTAGIVALGGVAVSIIVALRSNNTANEAKKLMISHVKWHDAGEPGENRGSSPLS